jgi:hypothetical protein
MLDEQADALGVEVVVGNRDRSAAQEMAGGGGDVGSHAAAEIDHLSGTIVCRVTPACPYAVT